MAIDFPNSPAVNDEFTVGLVTWIYTGSSRWDRSYGEVVLGDGITSIVALTQSEYDALSPPDADTLYVVTD